MTPSATQSNFDLKEGDVIKVILEFFENRSLNISQVCLERETGVYNGFYSNDLLFLRQLIIDGQWDDVLQFIQPLEAIETFNAKHFRYLITKYKYIELLCIRSEAGPIRNVEIAVGDVVKCLNQLEQCSPSKEHYNQLCMLLTLPNLCEHQDFKCWNPSKWRIACFKEILPLIEKYMPTDKKDNELPKTSKGDRLMQLIIKGILYESCVEYCQKKATSNSKSIQMMYSSLLQGTGFSNADLSLLSWLQSVPSEVFQCPFENKTLNVNVEQLEKPSLVALWSEMMLVTPIKPKVFPHSATPFKRVKPTDFMSKSLTPGLIDGLSRSLIASISINDMTAMSRSSFAATGFHLNSVDIMKDSQTSVDRLFQHGNVFQSSCIESLPTTADKPPNSQPNKPPNSQPNQPANSQPNQSANSQPNQPSVKINDESKVLQESPANNSQVTLTPKSAKSDKQDSPDLWERFQMEKQKLMEKLLNDESPVPNSNVMSISGNLNKFSTPENENKFSTPENDPKLLETNNENITPISQMGQSNYPNPGRLTTSTPKRDYKRENVKIGFQSPTQSPILPVGENGSQCIHPRNLSYSESMNGTFPGGSSNTGKAFNPNLNKVS